MKKVQDGNNYEEKADEKGETEQAVGTHHALGG